MEFAFGFAVQVVVGILGFPIAAGEAIGIEDGAVGADAVATGFGARFRYEVPAVQAGGIGEEVFEGTAEA